MCTDIRFPIFLALYLGVFAAGCKKFTDVPLPSTQLTSPSVFDDNNTAKAAMVDIYNKIRDEGLLTGYFNGASHQLALYTDELDFYGSTGTSEEYFYLHTLVATDDNLATWWNSSYHQVYEANAVLEGISKSTKLDADVRLQLMGEALFVRALIHFYLANIFGNIPYITTTDYQANSVVARDTRSMIHEALKKDLKEAIVLLPEDYPTSFRVRPNRYAAEALLARVNLYNQNWEEAEAAATEVINQSDRYKWPSGLQTVFLKESESTIWQIMPAVNNPTHEAETFIFTQGPPSRRALTIRLINSFSDNDLRKTQWIQRIDGDGGPWYHSYKYQYRDFGQPSPEYSIILRLAEQYLIRAESRTYLGNLSGAREDLNMTRELAGIGQTDAASAEEIRAAIIEERDRELFTEFSHRFFDLKRTGKLDEVLSITKPQWISRDSLLPVPESELLINPNLLPQNPGF